MCEVSLRGSLVTAHSSLKAVAEWCTEGCSVWELQFAQPSALCSEHPGDTWHRTCTHKVKHWEKIFQPALGTMKALQHKAQHSKT